MEHEIIFSRFQLDISRLYHLLIFNTLWRICYFVMIIINIFSTKQIYISNHNKLAFTYNVIYTYKMASNNEKIKIIELEGFNHIIYSKFFNHQKLKILKKSVRYFISKVKHSGSIKKLEFTFIKMNNMKYFILNISTNSLVKKISIINYKQLQVPKSFICNIFKSHIGLPQNYIKINQGIRAINLWYKSKGFDWVSIQAIKGQQAGNIGIKILEGKILKNILICTSNKQLDTSIKYLIEQKIKNKLGISFGHILNTKKIELGINYLKETQLIGDCKYKVSQNTNGLKVLVEYTLFKDNMLHIYYTNINLNNYLSYYWYQFSQSVNNNIIKEVYILFLKIKNPFTCKVFQMKGLYKSIFFNSMYKFILFYNYLSLKYSSCHCSNYEKRFISDFQITNQIPSIRIRMLYPSLNISANLVINLIIRLDSKLSKFKHVYPLKVKQIISMGDQIYTSILKVKKFEIILKNHVYDRTYFLEKINGTEYITKKNCINIKSIPLELRYKYLDNQEIFIFKKLYKIIKQNILNIRICIKYNALHSNNSVKSGASFIVQIISHISLPINRLQAIHFIDNSYENLYIQYKYSFIIPKGIKYIPAHYNSLLFFSEIYWSFKENYNLQINQVYHRQKYYIYYQSNLYKEYRKFSFPLALFHIEYEIPLSTYMKLYTFSNYTYNLYKTTSFKYHLIVNSSLHEVSIGYGIEFNIPITKLPPLRIEYGINNKEDKFFQLRAYSQYNDDSL